MGAADDNVYDVDNDEVKKVSEPDDAAKPLLNPSADKKSEKVSDTGSDPPPQVESFAEPADAVSGAVADDAGSKSPDAPEASPKPPPPGGKGYNPNPNPKPDTEEIIEDQKEMKKGGKEDEQKADTLLKKSRGR